MSGLGIEGMHWGKGVSSLVVTSLQSSTEFICYQEISDLDEITSQFYFSSSLRTISVQPVLWSVSSFSRAVALMSGYLPLLMIAQFRWDQTNNWSHHTADWPLHRITESFRLEWTSWSHLVPSARTHCLTVSTWVITISLDIFRLRSPSVQPVPLSSPKKGFLLFT